MDNFSPEDINDQGSATENEKDINSVDEIVFETEALIDLSTSSWICCTCIVRRSKPSSWDSAGKDRFQHNHGFELKVLLFV